MAPATINRVRNSLRAALELAAKARSHVWKAGLETLPDTQRARNVVLTDAQVLALVEAAYSHDPALGLLFDVLATTGARPSQAVRLLVEDLRADAKPKLMMPASGKGGGRNRSEKKLRRYPVPITPALALRLKGAAAGRAGDEPLLLRNSGAPWNPDNVHGDYRDDVREVIARCGHDPNTVTPYALRHSSITRQLLRGVPIRVVASGAQHLRPANRAALQQFDRRPFRRNLTRRTAASRAGHRQDRSAGAPMIDPRSTMIEPAHKQLAELIGDDLAAAELHAALADGCLPFQARSKATRAVEELGVEVWATFKMYSGKDGLTIVRPLTRTHMKKVNDLQFFIWKPDFDRLWPARSTDVSSEAPSSRQPIRTPRQPMPRSNPVRPLIVRLKPTMGGVRAPPQRPLQEKTTIKERAASAFGAMKNPSTNDSQLARDLAWAIREPEKWDYIRKELREWGIADVG